MKKKVLVIMGLCIMLMAGGCTKKGAAGDLENNAPTEDNKSTEDDKSTEALPSKAPEREAYNVDDYIKLGKYKAVEVSVEKLVVTDADVESAIQTDLENNATSEEIKDRKVVQDGDIVNIDFEGLKDGVAFEGGTAADQDLTIGSNSFIEGFEAGLIGKNVGDKVKLDLTFPKEYPNNPDLAGQPVVFNVTINAIKKTVIPELSEDYVKNNTDYESIEAYKKAKLESLEKDNEEKTKSNITQSVITALIDDSKISSYPQTLIDYYSYSYTSYVTQMLSMYGMSIDDYIKSNGSTKEEFDANVKAVAEDFSSLELVQRAIAKVEGMSVTDEEYTKSLDKYMQNYNVTTEEELLKLIKKDQIKDELLLNKALDYAVDNAVVTKTDAVPTAVATPTEIPAAK